VQPRRGDRLAQADLVDVVDGAAEGRDGHAGDQQRHRRLPRRQRDRQRAERADGLANHDGAADAGPCGQPPRDDRAGQEADVTGGEHQADGGRPQAQLAHHVEDHDGVHDRVEQVGGGGAGGDGPQQAVAEHVAEPLGHLPPHRAAPLVGRRALGGGLAAADHPDEGRGQGEAERVREHRHRRRDQVDQHAGQAGSGDLRAGPADLQLGVALEQLVGLHQRRQVGLVGDVEEDGEHAGDEADRVQLADGEGVELVGDRDRQQRGRAPQVAGDQHRPAAQPVHPDARRQADEHEGGELDGAEQADLERRGVEDGDRHQRQRQQGHLAAELADGLGGPQLHEVAVAPQAPAGLSRHRRPPRRCRGGPAPRRPS
jgi:hypothetical protein